ncbi:MAG: DNA-directed RNA polymerase subunit alpha [Candidatus Liptonbacteria bacterium]|nr:DNA-directed RNA polymerase subunit alpha [Candidatus Liptonbacteria bacterium]
MKYQYLSEPVTIKKVYEDAKKGIFEIEGLYTGYGLTVGNSLRRALLSSLPGTAITQIKIKNVNHEFSTLPGMVESVLDVMLNLKKIRIHSFSDEPQVLTLKVKGEREVKASDIKTTSEVVVVTPDIHIAALSDKNAELDMELTIEKGLGYSPVESRKMEKLGVGSIALDALFSPVLKVNYTISDMRVGERTDYNKVHLEMETDGTIAPSSALHKAANILKDNFEKIASIEVTEFEAVVAAAETKAEEKPKRGRKKKE